MHNLAVHDPFYEVRERIYERVLVPDDVARGPPGGTIRLHRLRDEDVAKSAGIFRFIQTEKFQAIHVFEIEKERALAAVDFERDVILTSVGKARGFKVGDRAVLEASNPGNGVVDGHCSEPFSRLGGEARRRPPQESVAS